MNAVDQRLVHHDNAMIQLLDPPFDKSAMDPGYIRGYVPGVRENGGQYTHAAVWTAMAFAELGDSKRAWELMTMINPVNHAQSSVGIDTYKVEPYVISADLYASPPHVGRGGWSWYTGSAGWTYRLILESLLGLRREGEHLYFNPCLPAEWTGVKIHYQYHQASYQISISQIANDGDSVGIASVKIDGVRLIGKSIPLAVTASEHVVEVTFFAGST
jgi:cellobiose phosphorylase